MASKFNGFMIVTMQRGFVWVGDVESDGKYVTIRNGNIIRRWGTTKGLGELVNGPTENTILDPGPKGVRVVTCLESAIIQALDVDKEAWAGKLV